MKRIFDITAAALGLLLLAPLFAVVAVLIKLDSAGPIFFKQERVGRGFRPFWIYKFRTIVQDARQNARPLTVGDDPPGC
jgi:lipopolysaccharide/colanic/teichoic acid biosynthesis glycosyltransferase